MTCENSQDGDRHLFVADMDTDREQIVTGLV